MAWTDKPTQAQIGAWLNLTRWTLLDEEQAPALAWIKEHFDRRDISKELGRVRNLYIEHRLDKVACFDSDLWKGFEYGEKLRKEAEEAKKHLLDIWKTSK